MAQHDAGSATVTSASWLVWLVAHSKKAWVGLPEVTWGEGLLIATVALVILAFFLFDALGRGRPRL